LREKRGIQTKVRLKQHHPNTINQLVSGSQGHHRKKTRNTTRLVPAENSPLLMKGMKGRAPEWVSRI